ncbi:SRPBCC domain-containing protein [Nocardioides zeicaulis]|uniref:SRPBCC domain-containing protein n=1 Tax=Nocardioides zeicaulis TaxID=1776857 RepID=A0ABV6E0E6_9ACTN
MPRIDRATADVAASPADVFAAFVDPDALAAWLPPSGMTGELADADLRAGGGFTMTLTYDVPPEGGGKTTSDSDVTHVVIDELVPDERVVWGVEFDSDDPDQAGRMTMTWTFTALDGERTRVAVDATDVPAGIDVDAHQQGLDASLAQLAGWFAGS